MRKTKLLPLVLALLLATLTLGLAQEELQVLITGDRNAAIKVNMSDGEKGVAGTVKASADLAAGKSAINADLTIDELAEAGDLTAEAYSKLSARTVEMIGNLGVTVPEGEMSDMPKAFSFNMESKTTKDSYAKAELKLEVPTPEDVPKVALDGKVEGSAKEFGGNLNYTVGMETGAGAQIPFTEFGLTIKDAAQGEAVTTTIVAKMSAAKGSPFAQNLTQLPSMAEMIKSQLQQAAGLKVEKVEIPPVEETDTTVSATVTIAITDLRTTLNGFIDQAGPSMAQDPNINPQEMTAGLKSMISPRVDNFEFTMKVNGDEVSGAVTGKITELDQFFKGYIAMLVSVMKSTQNEAYADAGPLAPYLIAFNELSMEQAALAMEVMSETSMTFKGDGKFAMEKVPGAEGSQTPAPDMLKLDANLNFTADNYDDYVAKAKAKGLPVAEKAAMLADASLAGDNKIQAHLYLFSEGDALEYYRKLFAQAIIKAGGDEQAASIVKEMELKDAAFNMSLKGTKLNVVGYSETSDLTKASVAILKAAAPQIEGTLTGAGIDLTMNADGTGNGSLGIYYSGFMPGKTPDQVKQALGLPASAKVDDQAPADAVKLVAVERPEVQVSGELAALQSKGQKLLATTVAGIPIPGTGGGSGGGMNWMLIIGGVLVLGLVGVGLAAGRKSA